MVEKTFNNLDSIAKRIDSIQTGCLPGAVTLLLACPLLKQRPWDQPLHPAHSFVKKNPSSADSRRTSCQLLAKERRPKTGKLPV